MTTYKHAQGLAKLLIQTGHAFGQKVTVVFTNMNAPLGTHIGNALEVIEAIDYLKGKYLPDTQLITETLVTDMLLSSGIFQTDVEAIQAIREVVSNGQALDKFREMIAAQNGDASVCDDYTNFAGAKYILPVKATETGFIKAIDSRSIGYAMIGIGAGRMTVSDVIDYGAGAILTPKVGDSIKAGDILGYIHTNDEQKGLFAAQRVLSCYEVSVDAVPDEKVILGKMDMSDLNKG